MTEGHRCARRFAVAAGICILAGVLLNACAARHAAPPAWLAGSADDVYAGLRRRETEIQNLRARFSAVFQTSGSEATVRRASGVLLVKKPDRFRLRLLSPFGFTVFDYVSSGEHVRIELPLQGKILFDGEADRGGPFSPRLLRQQFLRESPFVGHCSDETDAELVYLSCREADGPMLRRINLERSSGRVRREVMFDAARNQLEFVVDYSDYRPVSGIDLPFAISLATESQKLTVTVAAYEVNPPLADDLFVAADAAAP